MGESESKHTTEIPCSLAELMVSARAVEFTQVTAMPLGLWAMTCSRTAT